MISLLGVIDYPLITPPYGTHAEISRDMDRDVLPLPECEIDDFETPVEQVLRPAFDTLYQTVGLPRSLNYDEDGKWIGGNIGFKQTL